MNVLEVIKTTDEILSLGICDEFENGIDAADVEELSSNKRCVSLLSACNFVLEELYRDFATDCRSTVVEAVNGHIDTRNLSLCRVVSLLDSRGRVSAYTYAADGIDVEFDGKYNLTYARIPDKLHFDSDLVLPSPRITFRIFVYGVMSEYLRRLGDYNACAVWQEKYDAAIEIARRKTAMLKMPSRRWLC